MDALLWVDEVANRKPGLGGRWGDQRAALRALRDVS
jgi:hypothetical protein